MAAHCTGFKKRPSEEPTSLALELPRHRALLVFLPSFSFFFFFSSLYFLFKIKEKMHQSWFIIQGKSIIYLSLCCVRAWRCGPWPSWLLAAILYIIPSLGKGSSKKMGYLRKPSQLPHVTIPHIAGTNDIWVAWSVGIVCSNLTALVF